jgi:AcrR family transcriptional regulator
LGVGVGAHPEGQPDGGAGLDDATVRRVLDAATELLAREGPARTTLKWVAREADADPAAVADRWPTVEDLLGAVLDDLAVKSERLVSDDLRKIVRDEDADLASAIQNVNHIVARSLLDGVNPATIQPRFPISDRLVKTLLEGGMDERTARQRVLECFALEWGWWLFGPHLAVACGLGDVPIDELRADIRRIERRLIIEPPIEPRQEPSAEG